MSLKILITTIDSEEAAEKLAKSVISNKLAACANIIPISKSIYVWQEKLVSTSEFYLIFKTTSSLLPELQEFTKKNHPYSIPCLFSVDAETVSPEYLNWLNSEVKKI